MYGCCLFTILKQKRWEANMSLVLWVRRGGMPMPQIPQRVQQAVGQAVAQAAVNELTSAFASRFK